MTETFIPARIVVTAHPKLPDALKEAGAISEYLKGKGIDAPHGSLNDEDLRKQVKQGNFDLLVTVGGDGTMLRAAHLCAPCGVPILGINHGRLGFLFQIESENWQGMIDYLLNGEGWIENRMMLRAEHLRSGEIISTWYALNDAVVSRGQFVRPVHLSASVDGLKLDHLRRRRADRLHPHRLHRLRACRRRTHPASRTAQHPAHPDRPASFRGPGSRVFRRILG